jgi:membrane protease YdiL (CAAX protease family)
MIPPVLVAALIQGHRASDFLVLHGGFSWSRFWRSGGAFLATMLPFLPPTILLYGGDPQWSFASLRYPLFVCATIGVIAVQTFAEEALFRGYLYYAWLRVIPSPALVAIFWSAVFSALHWSNPDIQRDPIVGMLGLMSFSLFAQWLTVRTGSLDAAWGLHFTNNMFLTFGLNATPGHLTDAAVLQYTDRVYAAGGSYALDPIVYVFWVVGYALQFAAVLHPRSPFYLAPRKVNTAS